MLVLSPHWADTAFYTSSQTFSGINSFAWIFQKSAIFHVPISPFLHSTLSFHETSYMASEAVLAFCLLCLTAISSVIFVATSLSLMQCLCALYGCFPTTTTKARNCLGLPPCGLLQVWIQQHNFTIPFMYGNTLVKSYGAICTFVTSTIPFWIWPSSKMVNQIA